MRRTAAFSLLEAVIAVALVLLLGYLALAAWSKLLESGAIGTGAQLVADCLAEARQDALTQNLPVEVRFYARLPDAYGALQLHWCRPDGTTPPVAGLVILPAAAVIDATPTHSTLVTANTLQPAADSGDPRLDARTRCFHFLPSGATDLPAGAPWTLTVRATSASNPARFPVNWACLTLDPRTGRTQLYRP